MFQKKTAVLAVAVLAAVSLWGAPIRLRTRTLEPAAEPGIAASTVGPLPAHLLLQFEEKPGEEVVAELARRGIRVLRHVPENGVLAVAAGNWDLGGLPLRWAGPLPASDKLSPLLGAVAASGYLIVFHPDVPDAEGRQMVGAAGLVVVEHPALLPGHVLAAGPEDRVRELAARDEVAYVLPASPDLLAGNPVIACAGPLEDGETVAEYVKVGRGWAPVNGEVELLYVLASVTNRMPENTVRTEIARAFEEWAKYAKLRFTPGSDAAANRTIAVKFARGAHGDAYPFDGPGKVLAHTFYPAPPNSEPLAGDIHLDDDEDWTAGPAGVDLYSVLLHEAGHALGLGHSDRPGAVMYPYYRLSTVLSSDDIAGIRDLYGERQTTTTPPPNPPASNPPASNPPAPNPPTSNPPAPNPPPANPPPANPPAGGTDRTAPSLRIISPALTMVSTAMPAITFRGTASDNVGVTAVNWSTSTGASGKAAGTTDWTAMDIPLLTGTNTVTVRALDAAGNSTWRAVTVVRR